MAQTEDTKTAGGNGKGDGRTPFRPERPPAKLAAAYEGETVTRRRLFERGAVVAGGIAGAIVTLPALGFALGPVFEKEETTWEGVGDVADFGPDGYVQRVITLRPDIGEAGKTTAYVRSRNPQIDPPGTAAFVALSSRCMHLGCPVRWVSATQAFICPCHGGVYDFEGKVTGGPAVRPLDRFETRVIGDQVQLGPRYSVNSSLERFSPRDPGEHLDGAWQYLYPRRPTTAY